MLEARVASASEGEKRSQEEVSTRGNFRGDFNDEYNGFATALAAKSYHNLVL